MTSPVTGFLVLSGGGWRVISGPAGSVPAALKSPLSHVDGLQLSATATSDDGVRLNSAARASNGPKLKSVIVKTRVESSGSSGWKCKEYVIL